VKPEVGFDHRIDESGRECTDIVVVVVVAAAAAAAAAEHPSSFNAINQFFGFLVLRFLREFQLSGRLKDK